MMVAMYDRAIAIKPSGSSTMATLAGRQLVNNRIKRTVGLETRSPSHTKVQLPRRLLSAICQNSQLPDQNTRTESVKAATTDANSKEPESCIDSSAVAIGFSFPPSAQSAAFGFLSATSAAFAAAALAAPQLLLQLSLPGIALSSLDVTFLRIASATLIISAAAEYCIKDAIDNKRATSATYQRLMLGCGIKSLLYLAAYAQATSVWNPVLTGFYPTFSVASIAINFAALQSASAAAAAKQQPVTLLDLSLPKNSTAWAYAVFALLYTATAAACYAPEALFTGGPVLASTELLKHTWAPGFFLGTVVSWVLKDAADRGRLGASTFKRLNLGLAGLEGTYSVLLFNAINNGTAVNDVSSYSNLAGAVFIAGFCLYQYATAKKGK